MIDGLGGRLPPIAVRPAATTAPIGAATKTSSTSSGLSPLATAARDMAKSAPVDAGKVDRVKNAIALGTYTIAPDKIAERMIATDLHRG